MAVGAVGQGFRLHADTGWADPTAGNDNRAMTTRIDGDRLGVGKIRAHIVDGSTEGDRNGATIVRRDIYTGVRRKFKLI